MTALRIYLFGPFEVLRDGHPLTAREWRSQQTRTIAQCHQLLGVDPCRETVYVRLMLYPYYAGEQAQVLRAYERCRQVLSAELAVEPLPTTTALAEQIRDGTLWSVEDAPRYPPPAYAGMLFEVPYSLGHTPFVGREREYAWLVERWRDARTSVLLIEGEAGVGKSRLAEEFLGYASTKGAMALRSRIVPGENRPYAAVVDALRPLLQRQKVNLPGASAGASKWNRLCFANLYPAVPRGDS